MMYDKRHGVKDFINVYRSLPALWNANSPEYKDRQAKNKAYAVLLKCYRKYSPEADRRALVQKINSLRTNFRKEWNKVQESIRSGASSDNVYVPRLWYYSDFMFIVDPETAKIRPALYVDCNIGENDNEDEYGYFDDPAQEEPQEYEQEIVIPASKRRKIENAYEYNLTTYNYNNKEHDHDYGITQDEFQNFEQGIVSSSPRRKKVGSMSNEAEDMYNLVAYHLNKNDDEFLVMARAYTEKLRNMDADQRLYADHLINQVLLEGQLGNLNRTSAVSISQQCTSSTQTQLIKSESPVPTQSSYLDSSSYVEILEIG